MKVNNKFITKNPKQTSKNPQNQKENNKPKQNKNWRPEKKMGTLEKKTTNSNALNNMADTCEFSVCLIISFGIVTKFLKCRFF